MKLVKFKLKIEKKNQLISIINKLILIKTSKLLLKKYIRMKYKNVYNII